ncbi:hypothetical protein RJ639_007112 [Escallonia herrerae]|uniref:Uncharacterized protein n=1 Tax=Escallonia herrerae TaxID=1293975 RepID=A0AA89AU26_9ASTE|nr:hypothetical protein RJ639_007112 [Escallonia herrerae]
MERQQYGFTLPFSLVVLLGLVSFALCIAAEFKRSKREDLRLDGQLCYLPQSDAFGYGIAALILLFITQVSGNFVICRKFCSGEHSSNCNAKEVTVSSIFLFLSWWDQLWYRGHINRRGHEYEPNAAFRTRMVRRGVLNNQGWRIYWPGNTNPHYGKFDPHFRDPYNQKRNS